MNGLRAKVDYILKHNKVLSKTFRVVVSFGVRFLGVFIPVDDKAVLFSAHSRKYNDSPRAIYEKMIEMPDFKDFKFYWALDDADVDLPGSPIKVVPDTFKYFKTALRCKYWITCVNIERSLKFKKKKCIYLNTWHGIPIKTVGNCAVGRNDFDFSYVDYFCISGDYEIPIYEKAFNLPVSHLIKTGMPRNDVLYNTSENEIISIKNKLGLPTDKKVILYAPTWRDSLDGGKSYCINPPMNLEKWEKELGNDYVLVFRTHPYTTALMGVKFNSFVRDYSNYSDINELLKVSDILISDYSATIFDYAILERPIVVFAYDSDVYGRDRGFALDIESEMPGGICKTEKEVIERIRNINSEVEREEVTQFKNKYLKYGGNATEKCIKYLFNCVEEKSENHFGFRIDSNSDR